MNDMFSFLLVNKCFYHSIFDSHWKEKAINKFPKTVQTIYDNLVVPRATWKNLIKFQVMCRSDGNIHSDVLSVSDMTKKLNEEYRYTVILDDYEGVFEGKWNAENETLELLKRKGDNSLESHDFEICECGDHIVLSSLTVIITELRTGKSFQYYRARFEFMEGDLTEFAGKRLSSPEDTLEIVGSAIVSVKGDVVNSIRLAVLNLGNPEIPLSGALGPLYRDIKSVFPAVDLRSNREKALELEGGNVVGEKRAFWA